MVNLEFYKEDKYNKAYRIGKAEARMEIIESIIEDLLINEYESLKYKIRRLSEYEANLLFKEYRRSRDMKSLYEFI